MTTGSVLFPLAADWEARYRETATPGWQRAGLNPACAAWLASGELTPGRILIPGAGRSEEPGALRQAGITVTVVDVAPSAVAFQSVRLRPPSEAIEADLFAWVPPTPFDAIYDQTCLCAIRPDLWGAYAARLHSWLRPGGRLFVLFMQTGQDGGPPFDCDVDRMRGLFRAPLWRWPSALPAAVEHPLGHREQPAVLTRI